MAAQCHNVVGRVQLVAPFSFLDPPGGIEGSELALVLGIVHQFLELQKGQLRNACFWTTQPKGESKIRLTNYAGIPNHFSTPNGTGLPYNNYLQTQKYPYCQCTHAQTAATTRAGSSEVSVCHPTCVDDLAVPHFKESMIRKQTVHATKPKLAWSEIFP